MLNDKPYRFRCIRNRDSIYVPQYMHDVLAVRQHPEYEEIDEEGNVVKQPEKEGVPTIPIKLSSQNNAPAKRPKKK